MAPFIIRQTNINDLEWIKDLIIKEWGSEKIVSRGKMYNVQDLPGLIAEENGKRMGLLTYHIENNQCEIVSVNSLEPNRGIATSLLNRIKEIAKASKCNRIWLITTNDNLKVLRFYQLRGFSLKAIYPNAIELSRKLKPKIPLVGHDNIPIRDEIELEMRLE